MVRFVGSSKYTGSTGTYKNFLRVLRMNMRASSEFRKATKARGLTSRDRTEASCRQLRTCILRGMKVEESKRRRISSTNQVSNSTGVSEVTGKDSSIDAIETGFVNGDLKVLEVNRFLVCKTEAAGLLVVRTLGLAENIGG